MSMGKNQVPFLIFRVVYLSIILLSARIVLHLDLLLHVDNFSLVSRGEYEIRLYYFQTGAYNFSQNLFAPVSDHCPFYNVFESESIQLILLV